MVCPELSSPGNGEIEYEEETRVYDSTVEYTCNVGHTLEGDNERQCQSDGSWSGTTPTCRRTYTNTAVHVFHHN